MKTYLRQQSITISRQSYVGNKSSYAVLATVSAYVRPLTEEETTINGLQFGRAHFVMVEDATDIQEGDKVLFDSDTYVVEGVSRHNRGISLPPFKQVLITDPQKV